MSVFWVTLDAFILYQTVGGSKSWPQDLRTGEYSEGEELDPMRWVDGLLDTTEWQPAKMVYSCLFLDQYCEFLDHYYPLVIEHSHGKWPIYRWFSQLETSIYSGFSMAMLVITRCYHYCWNNVVKPMISQRAAKVAVGSWATLYMRTPRHD